MLTLVPNGQPAAMDPLWAFDRVDQVGLGIWPDEYIMITTEWQIPTPGYKCNHKIQNYSVRLNATGLLKKRNHLRAGGTSAIIQ